MLSPTGRSSAWLERRVWDAEVRWFESSRPDLISVCERARKPTNVPLSQRDLAAKHHEAARQSAKRRRGQSVASRLRVLPLAGLVR